MSEWTLPTQAVLSAEDTGIKGRQGPCPTGGQGEASVQGSPGGAAGAGEAGELEEAQAPAMTGK